MNSLLPLALKYLQQGYSVIPVSLEKKPLISWKEFQSRLATTEELVGWWTANPEAQIGIVTGKISNLTVIDIESNGDFSLIKDQTYIVETGGNGRHYYFKHDPDFRNAVRIFPAVDVRSEGGYVVAAGSKTQKGGYKALNTLEVANMSLETKTRLVGAIKRRLEPTTGEVLNYPRTDISGLEYAGFSAGMRNDEMTRYAGAIHAKIHPSLWPTIGFKLFEEANLKNTPPLPGGELRTIWNSISQAEQRQNPGGRIFTPRTAKIWGPMEEFKSSEPVEGDKEDSKEDSKDTLHASEVAKLQTIDSASTYPIDMKPFDEALLGGFSLGEVVVVAGQSGHGKRLHVDTPILTPNGWKRNGNIRVGDEVIGRDGKATIVTGAYPVGIGKSYEIEFSDGTSVIADGEHLWAVQSFEQKQTKNWLIMTTKEILDKGVMGKDGKEYRWFLPTVEPVSFSPKVLAIRPYTLGALLANGVLSDEVVSIRVSDEYIGEKIVQDSKDVNISKYAHRNPTVKKWLFENFHPVLEKMGLDCIHIEKFIPEAYLFSSIEDRVSLLRGLMDCKGLSIQDGWVRYYSYSARLIEDIAFLVRSLGGIAIIKERIKKANRVRKGRKSNGKIVKRLMCSKKNKYILTLWTPMNPFTLERKAINYSFEPKFKAISKIEEFQECEMRCLSVKNEDGLYVVNDFIVTHNTTLLQDWTTTLASGGRTNRNKLPALWFSYEVLAQPLWEKFKKMGANIDTPIYMPRFNETGELTWVVDVIKRAIERWGIKVIVIDHLGFLRAPRGNYANQADAITYTVRALKRLAVKQGLIICLQVHVRKTTSDRPDLNDIRDSLGIAQEADTVFFIGRQKDRLGMPTLQARLSLIKNRKSGISVSSILDFQFGRYFFNESSNQMRNENGYDAGEITPSSSPSDKILRQFDDF